MAGKPLSVGQLWLLQQMTLSPHGSFCTLHRTTSCPAPVTMQELLGLEKRGLCHKQQLCVFVINEKGRAEFSQNKQRLLDASAERNRLAEAEWQAEEAHYPRFPSKEQSNG